MRGKSIVHGCVATGGTDDWQTPAKYLDPVREIAPIGLDPATAPNNPVGAKHFYTEKENGLLSTWNGLGLVFGNIPYSKSKIWILKAETEAATGAEIVLLMAARTGARFFAPAWKADAINFISGRITFNDPATGMPRLDKFGKPMPAGFNSCYVYWGDWPAKFKRATKHLGEVRFR